MKNNRILKIVVDFDGTIVDDVFPDIGNPKEGVVEALNKLKEAGFKITIHSCRTSSYFNETLPGDQHEMIKRFLDCHKIPFDQIWAPDKPIASAYIDDKAIRYENNWDEIVNNLTGKE
ncbi:MAG: hypothetical protein ACUZ8O_16245 [Candidatus Anammoxibacter sp.]